MREEIKDELGVDATLIEGSGGVFDVTVDGKLIFSKFTLFRFPDAGEVSRLIKQMKA
ncbi:MAG: hypothetical protein HZC12_01965 [Nitrospirae bacterium]|nr:hypothetical protein [Nitrospirota bacterium]